MATNPYNYGLAPYGSGPYGGIPVPEQATDADLIKEMQYSLLENGNADADGQTLLTAMFTMTQITAALNQIENQFLDESSTITTRTLLPSRVDKQLYDMPVDNIAPRRISRSNLNAPYGYGIPDYGVGPYGGVDSVASGQGGQTRSLIPMDTWEADYGMPTWQRSSGATLGYIWEGDVPNQTFQLVPASNDVLQIELLYIALGDVLDGSGVQVTCPNDWTPYIKWGALWVLLSADGEAYDPERAAYCLQRYQEGVEMARLVLGGPMPGLLTGSGMVTTGGTSQ